MQKRFAHGLQYLMSYTNSKLLTNLPGAINGVNSTVIQDAGNRRAEWAVASFDTPQNFWASLIYELPAGKGKRLLNKSGVAEKFLGGWLVSLVLNYQSGTPLEVAQANRLAIFNSSQRPDRVLGAAARNDISYSDFDPAINRLFNPDAFTPAQNNAFGNAPPRIGDARGFGIRHEDASLRKNIRFSETVGLEFNTQVFNLLNRPQWGNANTNISASDFGKLFQAGPGRFVQLGMKLHF
jgi:hypothetical protein